MRRLWANQDNRAILLTLRAKRTTLLGSLATLQVNREHKVNRVRRLDNQAHQEIGPDSRARRRVPQTRPCPALRVSPEANPERWRVSRALMPLLRGQWQGSLAKQGSRDKGRRKDSQGGSLDNQEDKRGASRGSRAMRGRRRRRPAWIPRWGHKHKAGRAAS